MKGGILMIIADSNLSMSSRRHYSQQVSSGIVAAGRSGKSFSLGMSRSVSRLSQKDTFFSNSSDSSGRQFDDMSFMMPLYNRQGQLNVPDDYSKTDLAGDESSESTEALTPAYDNVSLVSMRHDVSFSYTEITRKVYLSLLDFIQSLSFRGMFYDADRFASLNSSSGGASGNSAGNTAGNASCNSAGSASDISSSDKDSKALSITNQISPTVWTVRTRYSSTYEEKESTSFSTTGTVKTADGRELSFNLDMSMSRRYMEEHSIEFVSSFNTILTDPLVINLGSNPVSVSDQTFQFDIDGDGKDETIAQMNSESGFLALDKNGDGIINDGSELFGTKSGNGFSDLEEYDSDENGWIDENDEVYSQLKVWVKDENGNDKLLSLKEADVGAIYLGSAKTTFHVTDDDNELKAKVRSSGVYLHEDGSAGSIQQVDF